MNADATSSGYGLATFECGKISGGGTLLTDCNNFKGNTMFTPNNLLGAGVASIGN